MSERTRYEDATRNFAGHSGHPSTCAACNKTNVLRKVTDVSGELSGDIIAGSNKSYQFHELIPDGLRRLVNGQWRPDDGIKAKGRWRIIVEFEPEEGK